jgi:hypothetical protein
VRTADTVENEPHDRLVGQRTGIPEHRDQPLDHVFNVMTPALLAQSLEPDATEAVLVGGLPVAQMPEFHRLDDAINNHGGAEPGP